MDDKFAKLYVMTLLDYVYDLLHVKNFGVNHAECLFLQIWNVLSTQPKIKTWFLECVCKSIKSADMSFLGTENRPDWFVDGDLICFIAHISKWEEFSEIANQRKQHLLTSGAILGSNDISDAIIEALKDDWEDQDFYEYFSS